MATGARPPGAERQAKIDAAIEANGARMRDILLKARDRVELQIIRAAQKGNLQSAAYLRDTLRASLKKEYLDLQGNVNEWTKSAVESTARQWVAFAVEDIPGGKIDPAWAVYSRKYLAQQMAAFSPSAMPGRAATRAVDLDPIYGGMLKADIDALRRVVSETTMLQAASGMTAQEWRKEVLAKVTEARPAWQFIDRAGKSWDSKNYFNMLNRTVAAETAREAYGATMAEGGFDLATVEGGIGSNCCPACQAWAGKIISKTGATAGYPTEAEARAQGLFHPRCRHYLAVVLPGEEAEALAQEKKMRNWAAANGFPVTAKRVQPGDVKPDKPQPKAKEAPPIEKTPTPAPAETLVNKLTPEIVTQSVDKIISASVADVKAGKIPLADYGGSWPGVLAQWNNGRVKLFDDYFKGGDIEGNRVLINHEFGHEVSRVANAFRNEEMNKVIKLFKSGDMKYDNPFGISARPEEMLADVYAAAMAAKEQESMWEEAGGRYEKLTNFVLETAKTANLPLPKWYK